ncbi:MAG: desulfoferrodoxin FeS4 iron-binding domain-containing protein [Chloroflexi bacterium]|nr:desulfoferrodoxin FeS4 iron-binding domain-containing protein [Chloroflexota bacterium]
MAVELLGEVYRCNICGNEVRVIKVGGGTLVCCGEDMEQIDEISHSAANLPDSGG